MIEKCLFKILYVKVPFKSKITILNIQIKKGIIPRKMIYWLPNLAKITQVKIIDLNPHKKLG